MKKLLMFLVLLTVSVGTWAVNWTNQPSTVTIREEDDGKTLVIESTDGSAFQTFWAANIANANSGNYKKIKFVGSFGIERKGFSCIEGSASGMTSLTIPVMDLTGVNDIDGSVVLTNPNVTTVIYNGGGTITGVTDNSTGSDVILVDKNNKTATAKLSGSNKLASAMPQIDVALDRLTITGTLSSDDAAVLNATAVDASGVTTVTAELQDIQGTATYMALPAGYSTADLESLKTKNPNLQVAMGFEDLNTNKPKLTMHSFSSNNVVNAANALNNFANIRACKYVSMKGNYGDHDLVDGTSLNFGDVAVWDFTGASFDNCNVDASVCDGGPYYASNDPFCLYGTLTLSNSYPSNAFYYFKNYSTKVVEIQLPTGITELPPSCMNRLGEENGPNYKLIKGLTDTEFTAANSQYSYIAGYEAGKWMPIDKLVIPDNIVTVGYECCRQSVIESIVLGSGVKEVQGGAFKLNRVLESVDCKSGISNCYLGDQAFNECNNMKHIQLSEGIVSLGNKCFNNSQNLESIRLPETLVNIGNECFKDGHALSSITIPENVEKIGKQAFALTALKDIYLTTTDPAKIPLIYTGGELFKDPDCTFSANEMYGNNSCPDQDPGLSSKTWDDAVDWYYSHCNLIGVLHYPTELANKVRADLAQLYDWRCEVTNNGGFGLPSQHDATNIRGHLEGTMDAENVLGGGFKGGLYSSDGWAQFALMKEYVPNQDIVYSRKYDDVWYTMCFPFDLTDEQLASAFNETFNIVDFSAVELRKDEATGKKELVLHFNNVAETTYKDENGTEYVRKRTNGLTGDVIREKSGKFDYNVYYKVVNGTPDTNVEYHHVIVGQNSQYKTKTFAAGGNANGDIVLIDGYLASAGHPYMIHPSTGAASGSPKVRCYFSGIEWKNVDENGGYDKLYSDNARTVDLGEEKTTDNFNQVAYNGYGGQTYTFKGNWRELKAGAPDIETVEQPVLADYLIEPKEPKVPTVVNPPSTVVPDPGVSLSSQDIRIYVILMKYIWPGETNISCTYQDGSALANSYNTYEYYFHNFLGMAWADYHNAEFFNRCKDIYNNYQADAAYKKYLREKEAYDNYLEDLAAYYQESQFVEGWTEAKGREAYNAALTKYNQYLEAVKNYFVLIPQNAYFLARKKNADGTYAELPKYYRETAPETGRTTGRWTQYSAIIQPNADALAGIEMGVGPDIQQGVKGYNIAFNEDYVGEFDVNEIKEIVAEAEEKGQKVEYMNIVYSINGEVVGRGSHSLSNLPQGMYIINGKKYLVK